MLAVDSSGTHSVQFGQSEMNERQRNITYSQARLELAKAYKRILEDMQRGAILNVEQMLIQLKYHFDTTIEVENIVLYQMDINRRCPGTPHLGHASSDWTCPIEDVRY